MRASGSGLSVAYKSKIDVNLLELFKDWRELIRMRANAQPGTPERSQLDLIFFRVLPVIVRLSEAPTSPDISLAREILNSYQATRELQDEHK